MRLEPACAFEKRIIDCLKEHYNVKAEVITSLGVGADHNASIYKAETQKPAAYFVKMKQGHCHEIGVDVLDFLQGAGIPDIILPLKTIRGKSTEFIDGFTLIVYPFVEGQDGFSRTLTDDQWIRLGKTLRQVHDLTVPASITDRVRLETYSPKWRESVRSFYPYFNAKPFGDEPAWKLLELMKEKSTVIQKLVDNAENLAEELRNESPKLVLCHSDIHGGNVLIDRNNAIYIVDWDDPIMAPKERDLMFIGGGVGNVWNQEHGKELFYQGYGMTEIDKRILAYYRNERIVEDIAVYCQHLLLTMEGGLSRQEMYRHFGSMFEPRGVVDIAFETYESL